MSRSASIVDKKKRRAKTYSASAESFLEGASYLPRVIEKVRSHPNYKDENLSDEEFVLKAKQLTDHKELHADFSHITDMLFESNLVEAENEAEETDHGNDFITDREKEAAKKRATTRSKKTSSFPIKLQLRKLNEENLPPRLASGLAKMFALKYGPLHAALLVGDVTIEWDNSSLVIPDRQGAIPDLQVDIRDDSVAMKRAAERAPQLQAAVDNLDFNEQIELMYDFSVERRKMIEELLKVISKYNRMYEYDLLYRNCQTFVTDAMKALGIKKPPSVTGRLKEYFNELKKGKTKAPDDFKTHEELDRYVSVSQGTGEFANLTQHDKEFLLCLYFKFHLESLDEDEGEPCAVHGCKMVELERAIEAPFILSTY